MATPDDLAGRVIHFTVPTESAADKTKLTNGVLAGHTTPHALQLHNVIGSFGSHHGRQFKAAGTLWSFTWLKFVPGWITVAPLTTPVLTGPMSGCYLFTFLDGGRQYVAHVGTSGKPDSDESTAVKRAWKAFITRLGVTNVAGADPCAAFGNDEIVRPRGKMMTPPKVVGYFDGAGLGWAMTIGGVEANDRMNALPGIARIELIKPMPLTRWTRVSLSERFKGLATLFL